MIEILAVLDTAEIILIFTLTYCVKSVMGFWGFGGFGGLEGA